MFFENNTLLVAECGKKADQLGKREGGGPVFIGVSAFHGIIGAFYYIPK